MLPFSLGEAYGPNLKKTALDQVLYTGFYPRIFDKGLNPTEAMGFYVNTYVERDLRMLINIRDLSQFEIFLKLCAGRTGQIVNLSSLGNDCGVNHSTVKSWLSVLEASYIIKLLRPLLKKRFNAVQTDNLFYFRDNIGNEVDIIWDRSPQPVPVEIKSGQTVSRDAFKGLDYFNKLSGGADASHLIYGGDETYIRQSVQVTSWRETSEISP